MEYLMGVVLYCMYGVGKSADLEERQVREECQYCRIEYEIPTDLDMKVGKKMIR